MRGKADKAESNLQESFPLFPAQQYDFFFDEPLWPIGLQSTAPNELKRRVAAARASVFLGLKSVDGTLKRYLKDRKYPEGDDQRLDLRVTREINAATETISKAILLISSLGDKKRLGEILGEWTLMRTPFSMDILLSCANRGALFEPLTIARMMLEQLSWSFAAMGEKNDEQLSKIGAQASIGILKTVVPEAGRFYGWLSDHAHWKYDAHVKSITFKEERLAHVFASCHFKAISMAVSLVLAAILVRFLVFVVKDKYFENPDVRKISADLEAADSRLISVFREIQSLRKGDEELSSLAGALL
jgi:hypothetical protein